MSRKRKARKRARTPNAPAAEAEQGAPAQPEPTPAATGRGRRDDDAVAAARARTRGLRHPLWMHPDVPGALEPQPELFNRLGLLVEQLAARGRCSVVKGCRGANRGWHRSPLGGGGGSQYYLWWTTAGSEQGRRCGLPRSGIAIRAARHHDDHAELSPGSGEDYQAIGTAAEIGGVAGEPWTDDQRRFREAVASVRVLEGQPGSGKTTALWHSVDAREDDHVLYVTWSSALAEDAAAHFDSFAAPRVRTSCVDYATLLAEILGRSVTRLPLRESREMFEQRLAGIDSSPAGAWRNEPLALHAELRSMLLGGATDPSAATSTVQDGCLRLTEAGYRRRRQQRGRLDERSMRTLVRAAGILPSGTLGEVFPELAAAHEALVRLADVDGVPERYADVDRIVIDEAQDLTLTETAVIARLCARTGELAGRTPRLLVAGDEGQTVRPSGFSWARTRELLDTLVGRPATYTLSGQVRCPARIAQACDRIEGFYHSVDKESRPRGQHAATGAGAGDGQVIRVVADKREVGPLIEKLTGMPSTAVVSATAEMPNWVPKELESQVLTPTEAKGLEYQTACVIDLGEACEMADQGETAESDERLSQELRRTAIDQARVAMTRATDTLVLIEHAGAGELITIEDNAVEYSADDLIEMLENDDATPEEQALALAEECRSLRDENIGRAMMRANQALGVLGDPDATGQAADAGVRIQVAEAVLATVCSGLLDQDWDATERNEAALLGIQAIETKAKARDHADSAAGVREKGNYDLIEEPMIEEGLLQGLVAWKNGKAEGAARLADQLALLQGRTEGRTWADGPTGRHRAALTDALREAARSPAAYQYRVPNVAGWLRALGALEPEAAAKEMAASAFDHLMGLRPLRGALESGDRVLNAAEAILATLDDDPLREARVEEAENRIREALRLYRKAGATEEAKRLITDRALWDESDGIDQTRRRDQEWLLGIEGAIFDAPAEVGRRIGDPDRVRLDLILQWLEKVVRKP